MFVLFLLLMVAASLAYLAEHRAQPVAFGTIPAALWWAVVTMTTVGYGDVVPITPLGKLLGGAIAIIGIGMVALPAGLLASGFSEQLHERERLFEAEVERRLADGVLDEAERQQLIELRKRLGLRARDASAIVHLVSRQQHAHPPHCPHCGLPLTPAAGPPHAGPRAKGWQAW